MLYLLSEIITSCLRSLQEQEFHVNEFPAQFRLKKRREFLFLQRNGKRFVGTCFFIYVRSSEKGCTRLGITVSKKVHKSSVKRNRLKRQVREIFRLHRGTFLRNFDMVVVVKKECLGRPFVEMTQELKKAWKRLGLFQE
jgi:ribonuclease P protein component